MESTVPTCTPLNVTGAQMDNPDIELGKTIMACSFFEKRLKLLKKITAQRARIIPPNTKAPIVVCLLMVIFVFFLFCIFITLSMHKIVNQLTGWMIVHFLW